jgi:hypothetical protein
MRKRRDEPSAAAGRQPALERPPQPRGYDWSRFGRHRLRAPASVVIDLPVPTDAASHVGVASVWPDALVPGGWQRMLWDVDQCTGRGWVLPQQLAAGDVLEFGADNPAGPVRWYGVLDSYEFDRWLIVQGPYPHAAAAYDEAQRLLGLERFLPALETEPAQSAKHSAHARRDRPRRHRRR